MSDAATAMLSLDDILAQAENPAYIRVATARVLLRQDLVTRHEELDAELNQAVTADQKENRLPVAPRLAADLEELEAEIEAAKVEFRFRSIGKRAWADLLAQHPPTPEQRKADARLDHNPVTFPVAAMAASCTEPTGVTEDVMRRLEQSLNNTQFDTLWARCIEANIGVANPKSLAASGINRLQKSRSAKPPTITGSPEASSLDE